ncbi:helix-turn-helix transcriptional regulator [Mycolicibacterium sp.]|uniref:helix-turn-helix transcriptional regulator n=1 Tax=Mycolicibacterium sp. TaxID=2320850 RepID=UPI003D1160CA
MSTRTAPLLKEPPIREDLRFESRDPAATEDFLARAYADMSMIVDRTEPASARIERRWLGPISFDELEFGAQLSYRAEPPHRICLYRVHDGRIEEDADAAQDVLGPGDITLHSPPEEAYSGRICNARYDLTMFDTALLDRVAATPGAEGGHVRLIGHRPLSAQAQRQLDAAIDYVDTVVHDDAGPTVLVESTTASMLAAAVLAAFPTSAATDDDADRVGAGPALLRRAITFIEGSADRDIALADIADNVHLTPRAVQYMFRRHLDTTPMEYLRRVRLDHAHRELLDADPGTTTVQMVASRWGFGHPGRFAAMYRQAYARRPSDTLAG